MTTFAPIQMLILEFDSAALKGKILPELTRLRDAGLIRLVDLLIVAKADGEVTAVEATDLGLDEAQTFGAIAGALIGFGADGTEGAAGGATAAIALIEHLWAAPLRDAIAEAGGVTLADEWIHPEDLVGLGVSLTS